MDLGAWRAPRGCKESDTTEGLTTQHNLLTDGPTSCWLQLQQKGHFKYIAFSHRHKLLPGRV